MGDAIKDAFAARMKRLNKPAPATTPAEAPKPAPVARQISLPVLPPVPPLEPDLLGGPSPRAARISDPAKSDIRMEGYLLKMSSGRIHRWQKRYFVLSGEQLCYYKTLPVPGAVPEKQFPVRLASAVSSLPDRQFELNFGNEKIYKLEAPNQAEASRWVNALESIIAQMEARTPPNAVDLADMDDMASIASSVRPETEIMPNSSMRQVPMTVWEAEVDTDALDRAFENWFHFVDGEEPRITLLLEATRSALEDMWSLFTKKQKQGERLDVKAVIAKLRTQNQEQRMRIVPIANEYVSRLNPYLIKWLDTRGFDEETVELLCIIAAFRNQILSLVVSANPDRSPTRSKIKSAAGWGQAWQTGLQEVVDRISGDVEVSLIERLRFSPESYGAWELPTINHSKISTMPIHGPAVQMVNQFSERPLFLSSWFPSFSTAVGQVLADSAAWRKGNAESSGVIAELTASALVAAMNSAWRRCYRRVARVVFRASEEKRLQARSFWDKIRGVGKSPAEEDGLPAINPRWENSLSFCNETTLMSDLCAALAKDTEYPEIYVNCLEGLAGSFAALKVDVIRVMTNDRLAEPSRSPLLKVFKQKRWEASPMKSILAKVKLFLTEVGSAAHDQVDARIVGDTMKLVIGMYLEGLCTSGIKLTLMHNLGQVMVQDEVAYSEFFAKNYARTTADTKACLEPISKVRTLIVAHAPNKLFTTTSAVLVRSLGAEQAAKVVEGVTSILDLTPGDSIAFRKSLDVSTKSDAPIMRTKSELSYLA